MPARSEIVSLLLLTALLSCVACKPTVRSIENWEQTEGKVITSHWVKRGGHFQPHIEYKFFTGKEILTGSHVVVKNAREISKLREISNFMWLIKTPEDGILVYFNGKNPRQNAVLVEFPEDAELFDKIRHGR